MKLIGFCLRFIVTYLICGCSCSSDTNENLGKCELTVYDGINYTETSFGPLKCGDYKSDNGDFDNDDIDSAIFVNYDNFTCFAYLFTDGSFGGDVLMLNGTGVEDATDDDNTTYVITTDVNHEYFRNLDFYHFGDTISSIMIRYQSNICRVSFFDSDHQTDQLGQTLGIGGIYSRYLLSAHGISDNKVTSISVSGDDSCYVSLYSDDSCSSDNLMAKINGTGNFDLSELEDKGFDDNSMSCAIISANSGLQSLTWHTNKAVVSNQSILVGNSQTIKNNADTTISTTVELSKSETSSWSFTEKFDFSITISEKISVSIPAIASIDLTISYSFDFSWTTTYSGSTTTTFDQSSTIEVPAYTSVKCLLYISKADLAVPYTAVFQEIDEYDLYYTKTVNGTFKTTSYYADYVECDDLKSTTISPTDTDTDSDTSVTSSGVGTDTTQGDDDNSGDIGDTGSSNATSGSSTWLTLLVVGILVGMCIIISGCLGFYYINRKHEWNMMQYKTGLLNNDVMNANNENNTAATNGMSTTAYEKL